MGFAWTIVVLVVLLAISWRFLGSYMAAVFEGRVSWLSLVERPIYRVTGVDPKSEQTWKRYSASVIIFSGFALLFSYAIFRLQGVLPFNPQHLPGVGPALAWNTAVSFVTNTNWQAYAGESTMSYLSQMGSLAVQNFVSAAVGIAVAVTLIRGFQRKGSKTIGNFWVDLVRTVLYILLPIAFVAAVVFMAQGAIQTLGGPVHIFDALNGAQMDITYIPMERGFVYLAVVLDWFSRRVLSWRVSITMEAAFCVETLEDALGRHGKPDIFNTDQGSQFTGAAFTGVLAANGIRHQHGRQRGLAGQCLRRAAVAHHQI